MVTERVKTLEDLKTIPGVGDARVRKYGEQFLTALRETGSASELGKPPDG
jgi:DNA-directed RNA polymerase sigma subunit (sigma70/sigma32)